MPKSTRRSTRRKPAKPHPDLPFYRHATGRWAKKIRQKIHYFGEVADDPEGTKALDLWLAQKDDLLAGRKPRGPGEKGIAVQDLCDRFLTHKQSLLDSGELAERTFQRYHAACKHVVKVFGKDRIVEDLRPDDFQLLRTVHGPRPGRRRYVGHLSTAG